MERRYSNMAMTAAIVLPLLLAGAAVAQPDAPPPSQASSAPEDAAARTPLAVRQQRVQRMMGELENKLFELATDLKASEPEHAEQLAQALAAARAQAVDQHLARAVTLLSDRRLDDASATQQQVIAQLQALLRILRDDPSSPDGQLAHAKSMLEQMLARQKPLTKTTAQLGGKAASQWTRAEQLSAAAVGDGEKALAAMAAQAGKTLKQLAAFRHQAGPGRSAPGPGTPEARLQTLHDDLQAIADKLHRQQAGPGTQQLQQQVEKALADLIAAIAKAQQQAAQQGRGASASAKPGRQPAQGQAASQGGRSQQSEDPQHGATRASLPHGGEGQTARHAVRQGGALDRWGALPPRQREKVLDALQGRLPARDRALIEQYYKSLQDQPAEN